MLDDLKEIEAKGYQNPYSASGAPPLVLDIRVRRDTKQEMDKKRGNLSSRLFFSLDCAALAPGGASGGDAKSDSRTEEGSDEVRDESKDGSHQSVHNTAIDAYLKMSDTTSANANHGDYSTILMTCIALTSRAEGSFSISRNKVEFSISCASKIDNSVYESELRRADNFEYPRHSRDVVPVRCVRERSSCLCVPCRHALDFTLFLSASSAPPLPLYLLLIPSSLPPLRPTHVITAEMTALTLV
jgi:hypothetical protein